MCALKLSVLTFVVENTLEKLGLDSWIQSNLEPAGKCGKLQI